MGSSCGEMSQENCKGKEVCHREAEGGGREDEGGGLWHREWQVWYGPDDAGAGSSGDAPTVPEAGRCDGAHGRMRVRDAPAVAAQMELDRLSAALAAADVRSQ